MMINLKDDSEKDKYILELFQTSPKEAFRLLFDAYHMKLCIYAVQLTDSFEMAEDIVQDFFIYFWEKKYYLKIKMQQLKKFQKKRKTVRRNTFTLTYLTKTEISKLQFLSKSQKKKNRKTIINKSNEPNQLRFGSLRLSIKWLNRAVLNYHKVMM